MAVDWEDLVGAPLVAVFGQPATYYPRDYVEGYEVVGVFDNEFRSTTIIDAGAPQMDRLPVFGVNASQFQKPPRQNDQILFPPGPEPHHGKRYIVVTPRPDSHGIYHLALQRTTQDGT